MACSRVAFNSLKGLRLRVRNEADAERVTTWITACIVLHKIIQARNNPDDILSTEEIDPSDAIIRARDPALEHENLEYSMKWRREIQTEVLTWNCSSQWYNYLNFDHFYKRYKRRASYSQNAKDFKVLFDIQRRFALSRQLHDEVVPHRHILFFDLHYTHVCVLLLSFQVVSMAALLKCQRVVGAFHAQGAEIFWLAVCASNRRRLVAHHVRYWNRLTVFAFFAAATLLWRGRSRPNPVGGGCTLVATSLSSSLQLVVSMKASLSNKWWEFGKTEGTVLTTNWATSTCLLSTGTESQVARIALSNTASLSKSSTVA